MDVKRLVDHLSQDGGFTYDLHEQNLSGQPYWSVGYRSALHGPIDHAADLIERALQQYRDDLHQTYTGIGGWVNDGTVYIEPVKLIRDRSIATLIGILQGQDAIFHLETEELLCLPKDRVFPYKRARFLSPRDIHEIVYVANYFVRPSGTA
jgi:hypothetical protein